MLIPRRTKYRKQHRPHRTGFASGGTELAFGDYGIQALESAYITNRQIEAARIAVTRHIKRGGKVWINIFPDRPLTKKPAETRMGSGKGSPRCITRCNTSASSSANRTDPNRRGRGTLAIA